MSAVAPTCRGAKRGSDWREALDCWRAGIASTIRAVLSILLLSLSPTAFAAQRVALVIRDAQAIGRMLKGAGFDLVEMETDVDARQFRRALADFEIASRGVDVALVYFSGHGVEIGGRNYLVPVDAELKRDVDVQDEAVPLDRVLEAVSGARRLKFVILDACRSNPFQRMQVSSTSRGIARGLAPIEPAGGKTLVAYAAAAGTLALDGAGDHSPFTAGLLKDLALPGLDVRLALGRVHDDVLASTNNQQEPFTYGSLGGAELPLLDRTEPPQSVAAAPSVTIPPAAPPAAPGSQASPGTAASALKVQARPVRKPFVAKLESPTGKAPAMQPRSLSAPAPVQQRRAIEPASSLEGLPTAEPPPHTLPQGQRMLVNDGSCPAGYVKEITGGTSTLARGRRCVRRG